METAMPEFKRVWTAEDVALVLIDDQKEMFENVKSETRPDEIDLNVRFLIRAARAFNIPVILSTVGVQMGVNGPTRPAIQDELPGAEWSIAARWMLGKTRRFTLPSRRPARSE